ncbi:NB-ARC domain-containing protein [Nocardioides taihuensis]|uniref:NB-ARC domain-containing protein n=1 Tax=Nocardioides taihuensis TaxID=1835606 RepID=A0ABW0BQM4_9ACTN
MLRLLDRVAWDDTPLPGGRSHALLAALVAAEGRPVPEERLVDAVWGDEPPANPAKALQVVVSRARAQTAPAVVERAGVGYRLGLPADEVDVLLLLEAVRRAVRAEAAGEGVGARDAAREGLALPSPAPDGPPPLADLRARAAGARDRLSLVLGRSLSTLGEHAEALPLLEAADDAVVDDATLACLLRSETAVRGAPAALLRYERHRTVLRDRLGVDPGPALQAVHAELLAADRPVRSGLLHDASTLVGRDADLRALRALVRQSRVTSIVGAGGLGKTRLAHVLGHEAEQPVVHFVELVGVAAGDDVVDEVGSSLGVRDSVAGRRVLTPDQRRDVRARIAQALDTAPTLLILDNCEHVVEAVADLVAFLVASAPRLRVVTTTRAPLAIAAERVYLLDQLADDDAVRLFGERARAARPDVRLDDEVVRRLVQRLDGLPLAIELAAAKVRVMSVDDVHRRLDDRFALLRGGDRSAPDRHQTLLAVIDWSWNLLSEPERRALRWFSVFHDGFTLAGAAAVVGHDPLAEVEHLVDQSLLTVVDASVGVRYRMLETVREFGRMQLVGAGEDTAARDAQVAWATGLARDLGQQLWSAGQVAAVQGLLAEENNLADCLREAMARRDGATICVLVAALGGFWTVKGENPRVIALAGAVEDALAGWEPGPEEVDAAVEAASVLVMNTWVGGLGEARVAAALMAEHGPAATDPRIRAAVAVLDSQDPGDAARTIERLSEIGSGSDRLAAVQALMWASHHRENVGDAEAAVLDATRALELTRPEDGPWMGAVLNTELAVLHAQLGRIEESRRHALAALPVLDALEANDDSIQTRSLLALTAMTRGDLDVAERYVEEMGRLQEQRTAFAGAFEHTIARAELALARHRVEEGLVLYRQAVRELGDLHFPGLGLQSGLEPWIVFAEGSGATAYAVHGTDDAGRDLQESLSAKLPRLLDPGVPHLDYPVAGLALHALGAWGVLRGTCPPEDAVLLLALAERFAYPRYVPTLAPGLTEQAAQDAAPGLLDRLRDELSTRRAPDLLPEARGVAERQAAGYIFRA